MVFAPVLIVSDKGIVTISAATYIHIQLFCPIWTEINGTAGKANEFADLVPEILWKIMTIHPAPTCE